RIADREREALDRVADRPPHLHDGEAAFQELVGLVREQVAHALRARPFGVIVVHAAHHLADLARLALIGVGGAQGVIEYDHARGAALGLHQRFHFGVVDAADFALVEEIGDLGVVRDETVALAIERKRLRVQPRIADGHAVGIERAAAAYVGRPRRRGLGDFFLAVIDNVVDGGLDGLADRFPLDDLKHGQLLRLRAAFPSRHASAAAGRTPDIGPRHGRDNRPTMSGLWHAGAANLKSASRGYTGILLLEAANPECSSTNSRLLEDISVNVARAPVATTNWRIADDRLQIRFRESQGARRHRLGGAQPAGKAQRHVARPPLRDG